jgi:hypothetical protein
MVDKAGVRRGLLWCSIGAMASQAVCVVGAGRGWYGWLLLGRGLLGVAMESLLVAQAKMVCGWFRGREMGLAVGSIITAPEIGDALNSMLSPGLF